MATRISPVDPATVEGKARDLLSAVKSKYGMIPNSIKTMANSPAALDGYLAFSGALSKGVLPARQREQVALAVSQHNGCEYCLSGRSITGKVAGLQPEQIVAARRGKGIDAKSQAILNLTQNILERRGNVSDEQLAAARAAGLTDAELVEVVGTVAMVTMTNFLNNVARPDVDFPKVTVAL